MKLVFPALCWAVLLGGFACAKRSVIHPSSPPAPRGEPIQEAPMPDPNETLLPLEEATFGPIFFDFDSYILREPAKADAVAGYLKKTNKRLVLSGHASDEGSEKYNYMLGARRARAVHDYIVVAGISADRIVVESYGESAPLDPNDKPKNRRVEIAILEAQ